MDARPERCNRAPLFLLIWFVAAMSISATAPPSHCDLVILPCVDVNHQGQTTNDCDYTQREITCAQQFPECSQDPGLLAKCKAMRNAWCPTLNCRPTLAGPSTFPPPPDIMPSPSPLPTMVECNIAKCLVKRGYSNTLPLIPSCPYMVQYLDCAKVEGCFYDADVQKQCKESKMWHCPTLKCTEMAPAPTNVVVPSTVQLCDIDGCLKQAGWWVSPENAATSTWTPCEDLHHLMQCAKKTRCLSSPEVVLKCQLWSSLGCSLPHSMFQDPHPNCLPDPITNPLPPLPPTPTPAPTGRFVLDPLARQCLQRCEKGGYGTWGSSVEACKLGCQYHLATNSEKQCKNDCVGTYAASCDAGNALSQSCCAACAFILHKYDECDVHGCMEDMGWEHDRDECTGMRHFMICAKLTWCINDRTRDRCKAVKFARLCPDLDCDHPMSNAPAPGLPTGPPTLPVPGSPQPPSSHGKPSQSQSRSILLLIGVAASCVFLGVIAVCLCWRWRHSGRARRRIPAPEVPTNSIPLMEVPTEKTVELLEDVEAGANSDMDPWGGALPASSTSTTGNQ